MTYEEFADSRLSALLRYALMLTGDSHTAEDLVQDTMVRVQLHWRRVAASDSPDSYVRKMLTNQFVDLRRGSWLRRVLLRAEPDVSIPDPADHAGDTVERDRVWGLLAELPRRQRAALVLRFYEDLPDQEIADILGCAIGTVRSSISRALNTLRAQMSGTEPEDDEDAPGSADAVSVSPAAVPMVRPPSIRVESVSTTLMEAR